ncbi:hypothetical protein ACP4OV_011018 [Aristida adscensionis]
MPSRPSRGGRAQASSCPCPCCCFCSPVSSAASRAQLPPLPSAPPTPPELRDVEKRLDVLTNDIATTISDRFSFCIADVEADWNEAFNYTSDLGFVDRCILETQALTRVEEEIRRQKGDAALV